MSLRGNCLHDLRAMIVAGYRRLEDMHGLRVVTLTLLLVLSGFLVRSIGLGQNSLWSDEAVSAVYARSSLEVIWEGGGQELSHPPLFDTLLHFSISQNDSEARARLPSAVASALAVGVVFLAGRRLFGGKFAVAAALLALFSPLDVWYAREARQAALGALFVTAAIYGVARRDWTGRILGALGLTLAFFSYYIAFLVWSAILGVALGLQLGKKPTFAREWLYVTVPAIGAFLPFQGNHFTTGFRMLMETGGRTPFRDLLLSSQLTSSIAGVLVSAAVVAFVATIFLRWMIGLPSVGTQIAVGIVVTYAILVVLMPLERAYSLKRVVVVAWPMVLLLVTYLILLKFPERRRGASYVAVLAFSVLATGLTVFVAKKDDWRSAISFMNGQIEAGDIAWIEEAPWSESPYLYYDARLPLVPTDSDSNFGAIASEAPNGIWLVATRTPSDLVTNERENWLLENWRIDEDASFHRLEVMRFVR